VSIGNETLRGNDSDCRFAYLDRDCRLLVWNAQKIGKPLDSYRSVAVHDNGLLFFAVTGRITRRTGIILARNGNAWNL
jgi:hypothetical protein